MKKNRMMRAASALLVAVLLTTCTISGTFAKYVSTFEGTDSARVAKWAFEVNSTNVDLATEKKFTFELFKTIYEEDTTSAENDVANGKIIAPGTGGSLGVVLTNKSEVNATYVVEFIADEKTVPILWSVDGVNWNNDVAALNLTAQDIAMNASANIGLYWKWAFNDDAITGKNDSIDTALGIAGTAQPTVTVKVTVEQVD